MNKSIHVFYKDLYISDYMAERFIGDIVKPLYLWSTYLNQDLEASPSLNYRLSQANRFNDYLKSKGSGLVTVSYFKDITDQAVLEGVKTVTMLRHFEPRERNFQYKLGISLKRRGIALVLIDLFTLLPPECVLKSDGAPYVVFTPFYRKFRTLLKTPKKTLHHFKWQQQDADFDHQYIDLSAQIEDDLKHFKHFVEDVIYSYQDVRDFPAKEMTSHASALITHGVISVQEIVAQLLNLESHDQIEAYIRQLVWRDFYNYLMYYFPSSVYQNFKDRYYIKWLNDKADYEAWANAKTGFPIVDSAILHMVKTGRMHNRLRMIVASFLTKDLLVDWRMGAEFFKRHLIDYDLALNAGGWQWSASTGADSVPYFRVFNPHTQSRKYDCNASFIKSVFPELSDVDPTCLHEPQKCDLASIRPIIDHKYARKRLLDQFKNRE